jgi:membrane protein YdbS with pleckstrin-like domain
VSSSSSSSSGIGFTGLLTILFIALRLLNKIAWSWWWVLSPMWIAAGIVALILLGIVIAAVIKTGKPTRKARK